MAGLTTAHVREYIAKRQAETEVTFKAYDVTRKDGTTYDTFPSAAEPSAGASNAEINRELTILKRMFSLAIQAGKLLHKPHIPLLREDNIAHGLLRAGAVRQRADAHLPTPLSPSSSSPTSPAGASRPKCCRCSGDRSTSRPAKSGSTPGTTKNREGRVFPLTDDLRALLEAQHARARCG